MPYLSIDHMVVESHSHSLYKRITSIGSMEDNDIVCVGEGILDTHCIIYFDGKEYQIEPVNRKGELYINEKRVKKRVSLSHLDKLKIGSVSAHFCLFDDIPQGNHPMEENRPLEAYEKLRSLALRLAEPYTVNELLDRVMDEVIDLVRADKGFLILLENGEMSIKVARNVQKETMLDAEGHISDSIVRRVVETRMPLIVSDALNDVNFNASMSVINLKLCSVLCVPLISRGVLIGIIYVGNDNIVNLFRQQHLELLTVFASQTGLILSNAILVDDLQLKNRKLQSTIDDIRFGEIIGNSFSMREVYKRVEKVAVTDVTVLIEGETGTGKELIAHEIHRRSSRSRGPFVVINCGAIPENLLESELFGHMKGAFTGAIQNKEGKFQQANGGTLFLDEIGEMPLELQVKLLRVLQERKVIRLGGTKVEEVDIRVVAATNKELAKEVKEDRFREDLYYRLNVVRLVLPPLRERGDDVLLISKHLLEKYARDFHVAAKMLSKEAIFAMRQYLWPGNIRQLENRLKKALIMSEKAMIEPEDLDLIPEVLSDVLSLADAKEAFQRRYINEILEMNEGNRTKTAKMLGVDPRTIFRHLEKESLEQQERS